MSQTFPFTSFPQGSSAKVEPFKISVPDSEISKLKTLLDLCPITAPNYENSLKDRSLGINRDWFAEVVQQWKTSFDWYVSSHSVRMKSLTTIYSVHGFTINVGANMKTS
jgi:hypothetical protein